MVPSRPLSQRLARWLSAVSFAIRGAVAIDESEWVEGLDEEEVGMGRRWLSGIVTALSVAALVAGCGSSSTSSRAGGIKGPSELTGASGTAPRTSGTAATPTTSSVPAHVPPPGPNAVSNAGLPSSTPISSTRYHDAVVKSLESNANSPAKANVIANCLQKVLEDAGLNTIADVAKVHDPVKSNQIVSASTKCISSLS